MLLLVVRGGTSEGDDIHLWPCAKSEGEHDGTDAIADIEDAVAFCIGSRPFAIDMGNG